MRAKALVILLTAALAVSWIGLFALVRLDATGTSPSGVASAILTAPFLSNSVRTDLADPDLASDRSTQSSPVQSAGSDLKSAQEVRPVPAPTSYLLRRLNGLESAYQHFRGSIALGSAPCSSAYPLALQCAIIELDRRGEYVELGGGESRENPSAEEDVLISGDRRYRLDRKEFDFVVRLRDSMTPRESHTEHGRRGMLAAWAGCQLTAEDVNLLAEMRSRALVALGSGADRPSTNTSTIHTRGER